MLMLLLLLLLMVMMMIIITIQSKRSESGKGELAMANVSTVYGDSVLPTPSLTVRQPNKAALELAVGPLEITMTAATHRHTLS